MERNKDHGGERLAVPGDPAGSETGKCAATSEIWQAGRDWPLTQRSIALATRTSDRQGLLMPLALETVTRMTKDLNELGEDVADALLAMQTEPAGLAAGFLARAAQSLRSSVLLASSGFEADAMAVMRTTIELLIDLAYILEKETPARIERFNAFEDIAQFKFAKGISLLHEGNVDSLAMKTLEERSRNARRLYSTDPHGGLPRVSDWDNTSLDRRAAAIGLDQIYGASYRDACAASHSGAATLRYVIDVDENGTHFRWGPSQPSTKPSSLALYDFSGLLKIIFDNFDLGALRSRFDVLLRVPLGSSDADAP